MTNIADKFWVDFGNNGGLTWHQAIKKAEEETPITEPSNWIFRGEGFCGENTEESLNSSFDRIAKQANIDKSERWCYEALMLRYFKRKAHLYLRIEETPKENDCLEWLSLMRHYEVPSRLLDFTYSFYVAYYFALKHNEDNDQACCIWAINMKWLTEKDDEVRKKINCNDFKQPGSFRKFIMATSPEKYIVPIAPFRLNKRMGQQQGIFLCPWDIKYRFVENLRGMAKREEKIENVKRFIIKADKKAKKEAFGKLKRMNISTETLFPDLAGFCKSLGDYFYTGIDCKEKEKKLKAALKCDEQPF